jgi:hypothetical protein
LLYFEPRIHTITKNSTDVFFLYTIKLLFGLPSYLGQSIAIPVAPRGMTSRSVRAKEQWKTMGANTPHQPGNGLNNRNFYQG